MPGVHEGRERYRRVNEEISLDITVSAGRKEAFFSFSILWRILFFLGLREPALPNARARCQNMLKGRRNVL